MEVLFSGYRLATLTQRHLTGSSRMIPRNMPLLSQVNSLTKMPKCVPKCAAALETLRKLKTTNISPSRGKFPSDTSIICETTGGYNPLATRIYCTISPFRDAEHGPKKAADPIRAKESPQDGKNLRKLCANINIHLQHRSSGLAHYPPTVVQLHRHQLTYPRTDHHVEKHCQHASRADDQT